jgi:hypothetical protein
LTQDPLDSNTEHQSKPSRYFKPFGTVVAFAERSNYPDRSVTSSSGRGRMSTDLQYLEEWIPERMDPGTVFVLENQTKLGHAQNPYVAVMSCPRCGTMGLITRRQLCAGETMICGGEACSAEYKLDGENIRFRKPQ